MIFCKRIALTSMALCVLAACQTPNATQTLQVESKQKNTMSDANRVSHMLFFSFNSSELPTNTEETLLPHANYLIANPKEVVLVRGFADEIGTAPFNLSLGLERAQAVKSRLIQMGVSAKQLVARSVGETVPLNHEKGTESQQRNRRVALYY